MDVEATSKVIEVVGGAVLTAGGASTLTIYLVKKYFTSIESAIDELKKYVIAHHTDIAILKDRHDGKREFYRSSEKKRE